MKITPLIFYAMLASGCSQLPPPKQQPTEPIIEVEKAECDGLAPTYWAAERYEDTRNLRTLTRCHNGKMQGPSKIYYPNGKLALVRYYQEGELSGTRVYLGGSSKYIPDTTLEDEMEVIKELLNN